jgi:hypothetical protein
MCKAGFEGYFLMVLCIVPVHFMNKAYPFPICSQTRTSGEKKSNYSSVFTVLNTCRIGRM